MLLSVLDGVGNGGHFVAAGLRIDSSVGSSYCSEICDTECRIGLKNGSIASKHLNPQMQVKLRKRYFCDYCGKSTGHSASTRTHEAGCYLNPNRTCSHCEAEKFRAPPLSLLIGWLLEAKVEGMEMLRQMSGNCPACMLAAIKQSQRLAGTGLRYLDFNYPTENRRFWSKIKNPLGLDRSALTLGKDTLSSWSFKFGEHVLAGHVTESWWRTAQGLSHLFRGPELKESGAIFSFLCADGTNGHHYRSLVRSTDGIRFEIEALPAALAEEAEGWFCTDLPDETVLEALWSGEPGSEYIANCVSRISKVLGGQLSRRGASDSARGTWYAYVQSMTDYSRMCFSRATEAFVRTLPEGIAGVNRRYPWGRTIATANFFLGTQKGLERTQALQSYPAAGHLLAEGDLLKAIDASSQLSVVIQENFRLSNAQVRSLHCERLALCFKVLFDSGCELKDLIGVLATLPPSLVAPDKDMFETALRLPNAWRVLGLSLTKYPASAVIHQGNLVVPDFCSDGDWSNTGARRLSSLQDSMGWVAQSIGCEGRPEESALSTGGRGKAVDKVLGDLRPGALSRLDDALHACVDEYLKFGKSARRREKEERRRSMALTEFLEDGTLEGINFRQLRDFEDYVSESVCMSHCIATYFDRAADGQYAAFALDGPERATLGLRLEINEVGPNEWRAQASVDQVCGRGNAAMPDAYDVVGEAIARAISSLTFDERIIAPSTESARHQESRKLNRGLSGLVREKIREEFPDLYRKLYP